MPSGSFKNRRPFRNLIEEFSNSCTYVSGEERPQAIDNVRTEKVIVGDIFINNNLQYQVEFIIS